jgi:hypothetical protein
MGEIGNTPYLSLYSLEKRKQENNLKITVIKGPVIEEHVRIVNFNFHGTASLEFDIYQNGYEFRHTHYMYFFRVL